MVALPTPKSRCGSKRSFTIHVRHYKDLVYTQVTVYVNDKQVKTVKGAQIEAPVNLKGLPAGTFGVKIIVATADGRQISGTRKYKTCSKKRNKPGKHRL